MTKKSRMFPFITKTVNPLGGKCPYDCIYCWSMSKNGLVNRYNMEKYKGKPRFYPNALNKLDQEIEAGDFVFMEDMSDLWAFSSPESVIRHVLKFEKKHLEANFLNLTKNPRRYFDFIEEIPENAYLGATVETDLKTANISHAPPQFDRLYYMTQLAQLTEQQFKQRLFIAIEPILKFSKTFETAIHRLKPWAVAVGYDNYRHKLPESSLKQTLMLIEKMEEYTTVYRKTLRKAWWEK